MTIEIIDQCIQLGIAVILAVTAIIMAVTLSQIYYQLVLQERLADAQLLRDRFEMYVKANEPVRDEKIEELKLYPDDFMNIILYK